jgi:hypothetical protein
VPLNTFLKSTHVPNATSVLCHIFLKALIFFLKKLIKKKKEKKEEVPSYKAKEQKINNNKENQ